jgi:hypothetical protein
LFFPVPNPLLRPFVRREHIRLSSEAHWLSDTIWLVKDRMEFGSGWVYDRKMFAELVAPYRIHVTADDMPWGADILLYDWGFRFTPYHAWSYFHGRVYRMRFTDECVLDADGKIHDTVRMYYRGLPVATMRIGPISRKGDSGPVATMRVKASGSSLHYGHVMGIPTIKGTIK